MHKHSTTGTRAGKRRGVNRDFRAFVSGWGFTCDPGPVEALLLGGTEAPIRSPWPPLSRGGGGGKSLPPRFLAPKGGPAHGLHPHFVVAQIWADRGGGIGGSAGGGGFPRWGGGGGCAQPITTTCIPPGGMCVWGFGGMEVCMR